MSPRFFRRPLGLVAAATLSLPLLAAASFATPPQGPAPQDNVTATSQPLTHSHDSEIGRAHV